MHKKLTITTKSTNLYQIYICDIEQRKSCIMYSILLLYYYYYFFIIIYYYCIITTTPGNTLLMIEDNLN